MPVRRWAQTAATEYKPVIFVYSAVALHEAGRFFSGIHCSDVTEILFTAPARWTPFDLLQLDFAPEVHQAVD